MVRANVKIGLFLGFGAVIAAFASVLFVIWPSVFKDRLEKMLGLTNTSVSYDIWSDVPVPIYFEFYMWNITNSAELLSGNATKIQLVEMGPYVFRENAVKVNVTWNDNATVTFLNQRTWHFVPEMSNGTLEDEVTTINVIIATAAHIMRYNSRLVNVGVNTFLQLMHESLFLTRPVSEWIFDGYEDPVLDWVNRLNLTFVNLPFEKFGWFVDRNNSATYDGVFNMNTGTDDNSKLGAVNYWNYENQTRYYDGECGRVKGWLGELWPTGMDRDLVYVFASDLCGYLTLPKAGEVVRQGVTGIEYRSDETLFDNGWRDADKACYCDAQDADCALPGAVNVSMCRFGAPAFVSLPHFLHANSYYFTNLEGLDPKPSYDFSLVLEPVTGIPLGVQAQLQINILIRHVPGISITNVIPDDTYIPMFWFRQEVSLTPQYARLTRLLIGVRNGMPYFALAMIALGGVLIICGVVVLVRKLYRGNDTVPLIVEDNTPSITQ